MTVSNVDTWEDDGGYVGRELAAVSPPRWAGSAAEFAREILTRPPAEWPHAYMEGPGPIAAGSGLDTCGVPVVAGWPPRVAMDVAVALGAHRAGWLSGFAVDLAGLPGGEPAPALRWWEGPAGELRFDRHFQLDPPAAGELGDGGTA